MESPETLAATHPLSRRWALLVIALGFAAAAAFGLPLVIGSSYATTQTAERTFELPLDFTTVRKILVRNDGAKQIVTMSGDSEFISQSWDAAGGDVDSIALLSPQWHLQLHGTLKVRTKDDYIGQQEIELDQNVEIEPDFLHSSVKLVKEADRLKDYAMATEFDRDDAAGATKVHLTLSQRILTHAPWFAHGIADRRVRESVEGSLERQEAAIRKFIDENKDNVPLLPLR